MKSKAEQALDNFMNVYPTPDYESGSSGFAFKQSGDMVDAMRYAIYGMDFNKSAPETIVTEDGKQYIQRWAEFSPVRTEAFDSASDTEFEIINSTIHETK